VDSAMERFLAEGMTRYKRASAALVSFGRAVEARLQAILAARATAAWGRFVPEKGRRPKSTKYWSEYPLFNAKWDGQLDGKPAQLSIDVNWFDAEGDTPFYAVSLDPAESLTDGLRSFRWRAGVRALDDGRGIRLEPDPAKFDLERDFGVLLDELARFLSA
jgi:hypothetical protein